MADIKMTKADQIRTLLKTGASVTDTAKAVGVTAQDVYNIRYKDKQKEAKTAKTAKTAKAEVRVSPITGKPVRKYKKRTTTKPKAKATLTDKDKITMLELDRMRLKDELLDMHELAEQLARELDVAKTKTPVFVDMPVPQPWEYFTFWQRLKVLFLGRSA